MDKYLSVWDYSRNIWSFINVEQICKIDYIDANQFIIDFGGSYVTVDRNTKDAIAKKLGIVEPPNMMM